MALYSKKHRNFFSFLFHNIMKEEGEDRPHCFPDKNTELQDSFRYLAKPIQYCKV